MGVSGSGKTTVGTLLAQEIEYPFFDADDFHPKANIEKMKAGIPLTDTDRAPWLANLNQLAKEQAKIKGAVITCSALKEQYREQLMTDIANQAILVFLNGTYEVLWERITQRTGHFLPPSLLQSQLDTLEIPADAITVDIAHTPKQVVQEILKKMEVFGGW